MTVNIDEDDLSLLLNNSDHLVLRGDVDANGSLTIADIDAVVAEIFDGDGDCPFDTSHGFTATGAPVNSNGDARINAADVSGVLRARSR